jgi:hypothetical protein
MLEIKNCREYVRKSINRHSCRVYKNGDSFYMLDRTTDASPPFFTFYALSGDPQITTSQPKEIKVNGKSYWGDGISWKKAEAIIEPIVDNDRGFGNY